MSPTLNNKEEILERGEKEALLPDSAVVEDGEEGGGVPIFVWNSDVSCPCLDPW